MYIYKGVEVGGAIEHFDSLHSFIHSSLVCVAYCTYSHLKKNRWPWPYLEFTDLFLKDEL